MSFEDIKDHVRGLPEEDLSKLIAYLSNLKRLRDPEVIEKMKRRKADRGTDKFLTPDEFEVHLKST